MHHGGTDKIAVVGQQRAGKATDGTGDHEGGKAIAIGWKTDRLHAPIVGARALDHQAEARIGEPPNQVDRGNEQEEA